MANAIGYEQLTVSRAVSVSPALSTLTGGVACAVFYVDPAAKFGVRWRPDPTSPTPSYGFPLAPGKWISVAGEGNIRNSEFILDGGGAGDNTIIHVMYFDRVDIVAAEFAAGRLPDARLDTVQLALLVDITEKCLLELRRITLGTSLITDVELAKEIPD